MDWMYSLDSQETEEPDRRSLTWIRIVIVTIGIAFIVGGWAILCVGR